MSLTVAAETAAFRERFETNPPHAVLLSGPVGAGLLTLAEELARSAGALLDIVRPEAKTKTGMAQISVERIRELYSQSRSAMNGAHFIVIDDADTMNLAAQNALLKLLEEPNKSINFILTSHSPDRLLPTIRSRLQPFGVPPIDRLASSRLLKTRGVSDEAKTKQLLFIAEGLPAELSRLASDESLFRRLSEQVAISRQFIQGSSYERLIIFQTFKDDRRAALEFIDTTLRLLRRVFALSPTPDTARLIDRLLGAREAVQSNGSIKLQLSAAVV